MGSRQSITRPHHRPILCASSFLLLIAGGAIINIAVAWAIEARTPLYTHPVTLMSRADSRAFVASRVGEANDEEDSLGMQTSAFGATYTAVPYSRTDAQMTVYYFAYDWRYGWPMRSLTTDAQVSGTGRPQTLPTRPLWPGFAINTVFYAAVLWGIFAAPFALRGERRRRRINRGLCPKCAYPVGASEVCTECGAAVGGAYHPLPLGEGHGERGVPTKRSNG